MKVKELIEVLQNLENQEQQVFLYSEFNEFYTKVEPKEIEDERTLYYAGDFFIDDNQLDDYDMPYDALHLEGFVLKGA